MKVLLIGKGEIGTAIYNVYSRFCERMDWISLEEDTTDSSIEYELMLVTVPFGNKFVDAIDDYASMYCVPDVPKIIFSTVQIGTTSQLVNAVHCPIEGKHPHLEDYVRHWPRFVGGLNKTCLEFLENLVAVPIHQFSKPEVTEFLKLQSTTNYALMIEYARYVNKCCEKVGVDYDAVEKYNIAYNDLYEYYGNEDYPIYDKKPKRYILHPPYGKQGGHCTLPNTELLNEFLPNELLQYITETNKNLDKNG